MEISCLKLLAVLSSSYSPCIYNEKGGKGHKAEIDAWAAEAYTCGPSFLAAGLPAPASVAPSRSRNENGHFGSCFVLSLSFSCLQTKCSGWWLRFKDGEADAIARDPAQRSDREMQRWLVVWNSEEKQGILVGWSHLKLFNLMQYLSVYTRQT
jgi:hypothetical protein